MAQLVRGGTDPGSGLTPRATSRMPLGQFSQPLNKERKPRQRQLSVLQRLTLPMAKGKVIPGLPVPALLLPHSCL